MQRIHRLAAEGSGPASAADGWLDGNGLGSEPNRPPPDRDTRIPAPGRGGTTDGPCRQNQLERP
jgi:hypothetical protein